MQKESKAGLGGDLASMLTCDSTQALHSTMGIF